MPTAGVNISQNDNTCRISHTKSSRCSNNACHATINSTQTIKYKNMGTSPPQCDKKQNYRWLSLYATSLSADLFQCYKEHQYPIRGQILRAITCAEPSPGLSGNVMQVINSASKYGAKLTSKCQLVSIFNNGGDSQEPNPGAWRDSPVDN